MRLDSATDLDVDVLQLLSAGQWQKIALSRALYRCGDVLILDEPTAQLDTVFSDLFFRLLPDFQKTYALVILITHKTRYLDRFDRVIFIDHNTQSLSCGSPSHLLIANENYSQLVL